MKIIIELPEWTKGVCVTYYYYTDDGDGEMAMGVKALTGDSLSQAVVEEDDCK